MPWFYVSQLLASLRPHLFTRPFHGIYTISWRHKIFKQIVTNRYLQTDPDFLAYLHRNVAEYFLGIWSLSRPKPISYEVSEPPSDVNAGDSARLTYDKPIVRKFHLALDRLVPSQPIKYTDFHTHISPRFNLRKLDVLPYHLFNANLIEGNRSSLRILRNVKFYLNAEQDVFLNPKKILSFS